VGLERSETAFLPSPTRTKPNEQSGRAWLQPCQNHRSHPSQGLSPSHRERPRPRTQQLHRTSPWFTKQRPPVTTLTFRRVETSRLLSPCHHRPRLPRRQQLQLTPTRACSSPSPAAAPAPVRHPATLLAVPRESPPSRSCTEHRPAFYSLLPIPCLSDPCSLIPTPCFSCQAPNLPENEKSPIRTHSFPRKEICRFDPSDSLSLNEKEKIAAKVATNKRAHL
jgi:hypothetical protein